MKLVKFAAVVLAASLSAVALTASAQVMVGGAPMYASKDIIDNAVNSKDHTTLVAAVKAAGLVETLKGQGPFTVFAPVNAAFAALPAGTVDTPAQAREQGAADQGAHLPRGDGQDGLGRADEGDRRRRRQGDAHRGVRRHAPATKSGNTIMVADESGGTARVTIADVVQSNGVIHVVDKVLLPK